MLTYAIGFVQDVQLACFAVVLTCMALQDRGSKSLRWLAYGFGIAVSNERKDVTWDQLQHEADVALYAAKGAGRNVSRLYDASMVEGPTLVGNQEGAGSIPLRLPS